MEYVYAALLVHKAGKKVDEESVARVLDAAGTKPDTGRVRALVAALQGVNIDETLQKAAAPVAVAATAAPAAGGGKPAEDKKKSAEEEKKSEEAAAAGLGALFG